MQPPDLLTRSVRLIKMGWEHLGGQLSETFVRRSSDQADGCQSLNVSATFPITPHSRISTDPMNERDRR